jgi:hypothetical protein
LQSVQFRKGIPWHSNRITACNALIAIEQRKLGVSKNRGRERKNRRNAKPNAQQRLQAHPTMRRQNKERLMTAAESKGLKEGNRVFWRGDANDRGRITKMSWDAVTIAWDNGQVARVHHGDMREIQRTPVKPVTV